MNRTDLAEKIAADYGISKPDANAAIEVVLTAIMRAVAAGEDVKIPRFGTFRRSLTSERAYMNISTGQKNTVPAHFTPRFRIGPEFIKAVREGNTNVALRKDAKGAGQR